MNKTVRGGLVMKGRGSLVVRSRPRGRRVPSSKPDSIENAKSDVAGQMSSCWCDPREAASLGVVLVI
ncbi:hypothetical protein AVEN_132663-1 [Araneus ventricosus]|uniref:Uncharacterized protein n=1 Tax=Araneus ventricosus TaxID=182803 RepID=A0A4Y2AVM0_ARAVE|nr:hypothetical protein AVEN_132663-1 [Araneus ventricosus]